MSASTQRQLGMRVVPEGTNSHQVIQQLLLIAQKGLTVGRRSTEERPPPRKKANKGGRKGT